jgi:hypothetical protein
MVCIHHLQKIKINVSSQDIFVRHQPVLHQYFICYRNEDASSIDRMSSLGLRFSWR